MFFTKPKQFFFETKHLLIKWLMFGSPISNDNPRRLPSGKQMLNLIFPNEKIIVNQNCSKWKNNFVNQYAIILYKYIYIYI